MIENDFTELFGLSHPIALAPMGVVAGGELAAAVSNAGGLGFVGGGYGDPAWMQRELRLVVEKTDRAWGVGLITWKATAEIVALALSYRPRAFFLSFGDPSPFVETIKAQGCLLVLQVQSLAAAREARAMGADLIVAQGAEAGGHGASRATLPLVPAVVDAVAPIPVLAAGGIADGRGLAAALALGALGGVIGTRYCATTEALMHPNAQERLVHASGDGTLRTRVFDIARGYEWPRPFTGRALRNRFTQRWHGREDALAADAAERAAYDQAARDGDFDVALVWGGEAVDLVSRIEPAGALTERIGRDAESLLRRLADDLT
ncbi:MAG TPA: nitronate monooxygenase [Burkholderiales bacterium]|nr:nitronate monooxygenase [Burkholderiales bacterium]